MDIPADKLQELKQRVDSIKGLPGMSGVEIQRDRVFILTNGMTSRTKSAIREKLGGETPIEFYEIGPIKAQTAATEPNSRPRE